MSPSCWQGRMLIQGRNGDIQRFKDETLVPDLPARKMCLMLGHEDS